MWKAQKSASAGTSSSSSADAASARRPASATEIATALLGNNATSHETRTGGASTDADSIVGDVGGGSQVEVFDLN